MSSRQHPWAWAASRPDSPALILADTGVVLSYKDMMTGANRYANLFDRLGLVRGDSVALLMENQVQFPQVCWAVENSGLYLVAVGTQLNSADAAYVIDNSNAKVLITSRANATIALALLEHISPNVKLFMSDGTVKPFLSLEEAGSGESSAPLAGRCRGDVLLYSSGTTGRPKGIRRELRTDVSPEMPYSLHTLWTDTFGLNAASAVLNPGPFYHSMPYRTLMEAHREGASVVSSRKFDALTTLKAIEKYHVSIAIVVPTMLNRIVNLPQEVLESTDVASVSCLLHTAAPCSIALKQRVIDWLGPVVLEIYGGSEGVGNTLIDSHEWMEHKGSVGRPTPGTEIHVLDGDGNECEVGEPGLVYLTNGRTFEYFRDPAKTAETRNAKGWVTLGDVGYVDSDGYLYLTDRQSNLIISGGVNIYPQEAESLLSFHPEISDVAVIGVPNVDFGEEVKAVVVSHRQRSLEEQAEFRSRLMAYCSANLSAIKCPRSIDFVDSLPRSDAGKILKKELRKRYWPEGSTLVL